MKKIILFTFLAFTLFLITARAETLQINVEPSDIWTGDSVDITCWYIDVNSTSTTPYAYIENINQHSRWIKTDFSRLNDTYFVTSFTPPSIILGSYQVICSNGTVNSSSMIFRLSKLTFSAINYPSTVYVGEKLIIHAKLLKTTDTDEFLSSNVNFDIRLNDKNVDIDNDATYYLNGEWIITTKELLSSVFNPGTYTLTINASYMGKSLSSTKSIELKNPVEFNLLSVDKSEVFQKDNLTVSIKAVDKGNPIPIQDLQLKIQIGNQQCDIIDSIQVGNNLNLIVSSPSLSPGSYNMSVKITYNDYVWTSQSVNIDYGVTISVNMKDSNDKAVTAQFRFLLNGVEKRKFITDSSGSFSGYIPPGKYDVEMEFPNSKLILYGALINDFDNPIKFDNPSTEVNIPGIGVGDIYVFEVALSYSSAYLELKYDSSKILNEDEITVYKCENWNFGRKICNSDWKIISTDIDTIRDFIKINTSSLSTFLVGYKKSMTLDFSTDKSEYYLKDIMKVTGIVEDEDGKPVQDVQITASIQDTDISTSAKTDNNGVFAFEMQGPDKEDEYNIFITADKPPFTSVNSSKTIKFVRSSQLSVLVPESFQISQGKESIMWISLVNIGQVDFNTLTLKITGIPEEYYTLPMEISELKAGEEKRVAIDFKIPEKTGITSHTGKVIVTYDSKTLEEQFILTILSGENANASENQTTGVFKLPSFTLLTGKLVLPNINNGIIVLVLSSLMIFSFTVILKKKRVSKDFERKDVKNLLLDIKREVERFPTAERIKKSEKLKGRVRTFRKALKK